MRQLDPALRGDMLCAVGCHGQRVAVASSWPMVVADACSGRLSCRVKHGHLHMPGAGRGTGEYTVTPKPASSSRLLGTGWWQVTTACAYPAIYAAVISL
jgi:hypothetical protein